MELETSSVTRRQGRDTQSEILNIALSLFVKKGFHQTSMQDIAEAAGLTKGGLYYYLKSKDDVLFRLHDRFINEGLYRLRQVESNDFPIETKIIHLLKTHLEIIHDYKDDITLFFQSMGDLSLENYVKVKAKRDEYEQIFVNVIEKGREEGIFTIEDSQIIVLYILGSCNFMYTWYKPNGEKTLQELADIFITFALKGLKS